MSIIHAETAQKECAPDLADRYVDLLRDCLTFSLWEGRDGGSFGHPSAASKWIQRILQKWELEIVKSVNKKRREEGMDWPRLAYTMTGEQRMKNLQECVRRVLDENIPGDFIETGVWRGGACILMRGMLAARGVTDRRVWVADSFAGLPPPDPRHPVDTGDRHHEYTSLAVSLEEVRENFRRFGLLDDRVCFLPGWFKDTLPSAPISQLAVLRLDGDMYGSTSDALNALYHRLADGGFCIIDDFALKGCRRAVEDFRALHGIEDEMVRIDWTGVYWRRGR